MNIIKKALVTLIISILPFSANAANVFKCTAPDGKTAYSRYYQKCDGGYLKHEKERVYLRERGKKSSIIIEYKQLQDNNIKELRSWQ